MSTRVKEKVIRGGMQDISRQPNRFLGLYIAAAPGLVISWIIHIWVFGIDLHWGRLAWAVHSPAAAPYIAVAVILALAAGLALLSWRITDHRKPELRGALAGSVATVGLFFGINVGTGPSWLWSGLFVLAAWTVALVWSIVRLDVARNDKTTDGEAKQPDGLLEKLGLKDWRARKITPVAGPDGEPLATEIELEHAPGDTIDPLRDAVPNIESVTGSPAGLSRAVATDRADRSVLTVQHVDPLKKKSALPEPFAPGGSIMEPLMLGTYSTGAMVHVKLAGGEGHSPTSYLFMGMNRTGKTQGENEMLTDVISRRDVAIMYLNRAKGMQDVRVIIPGVEVALIVDEADQGGLYRQAIRKVKSILAYRQRQLALYAIHEWNAGQCWDNPPWRTDESGKRVRMERMPFLIVHFAEADAILASSGSDAVFIVSKGLSVGIATGWSLQRADHTSMPTGLRFNLGTAVCFGCGDDVSAGFALSDHTLAAGAHPERWGQRMPGYFYFEGLGIDESLFPVPARTFSTGPGGTDLRDEMLRRNMMWAPRMAKLDQGSVNATADPVADEEGDPVPWWTRMSAETDVLRNSLLAGTATPAATARPATATAGPQVADDDDDLDEDEEREIDRELEEEMRETQFVEGTELYPTDPDDGTKGTPADATKPLRQMPEGEEISWDEDDLPAPRDRKAAIEMLVRVFTSVTKDDSLRDPADPTGRTWLISASMIAERYGYRSRPFFVEVLAAMTAGTLPIPGDFVLEPATDLGARRALFRLSLPHAA